MRGRPKKQIQVVRWSEGDGITPAAIDVAHRRVFNILNHWRLMDYDLERLLVSCYFQGVHDMAGAAISKPECLTTPLPEEPAEYQI
jgi:hypothetical protein